MKKSKKIILGISVTTMLSLTISCSTILPFVLKDKNTKTEHVIRNKMHDEDWMSNKPFIFNNKTYLNLEDAYDDFLKDNQGINVEQFIGEVNNKNEDGSIVLKNNPLEKFDPTKIFNAYMDANGRFTDNYDDALKSFINASNLVTQYYDYKGNYFLDEEDAKYSMDNFKSMGLAYYKVKDFRNNYYKINPLNDNDIDKLKEIALEWIMLGPNSENNAFDFKIVGKDGNNYSKQKEVNLRIINEFQDFFNNHILNKIYDEISILIKNFLMENQCIKTKILIKPWVLQNSNLSEFNQNFSVDVSYPSNRRYKWYFDGEGIEIETKSLNKKEFDEVAKIFTKRDEFIKYFNIKNINLRKDAGFSPKAEQACGKGNLSKFFYKIPNIYFNRNPQPNLNSEICDNKIVSRILTSSDIYTGGLGPDYTDNFTLTFGLYPYFDEQYVEKLVAKINNLFYYNNLLDKILVNSINESIKIDYPNVYNFFSQFIVNVNGKKELNIKINNNNVIEKDIFDKSKKSIFNINAINAVENYSGIKIPVHGTSNGENYLTKVFKDVVKENDPDWKSKLGIEGNNQKIEDKFIDQRQWTYYVSNQNFSKNNNVSYDDKFYDYLGFNTETSREFCSKFINLNNIIATNFYSFDFNFLSSAGRGNFLDFVEQYNFYITYNNMPLFKIKENDFNELYELLKIIFDLNWKSTNTTHNIPKEYINLLENVSTSFVLNDSTSKIKNNQYIDNGLNNINYKNNQSLELKINNIENYNLSPTWNHLPIDNSEPSKMKNGIFDTISLYNQNIKKLSTNDTNKDILNKNKPNDFVMLFDKYNGDLVVPKELEYAETIMGVDNINLSLSNKSIQENVAYNFKQLDSLEKRLQIFNKPAKVYFIYCGTNLINAKAIYNDNQINPDYFDSPELVIENALRNYWLKPDNNYIIYKDNYQSALLKNNKFVLYNFRYNNKYYFFEKYSDAKQKIVEIIKFNSYRVN